MFLGIDLGTGSVKALLMDGGGAVLAEASEAYPVLSPQPGQAETPPDLWWQATVKAVRRVTADAEAAQPGGSAEVPGAFAPAVPVSPRIGGAGPLEIRAIGFSGQGHGLVALDRAHRILCPAILWPDTRAGAEMAELLALPESTRLPLANPVVPGMMALSLMWLRRNRPEVFSRLALALSPKDWLRLRMGGAPATEPSDASMTLLWDLGAEDWADPVLQAVGLTRQHLPPVLGSTGIAGHLGAAAAAELGLRPGIPMATGLADSAACLLGMGLVRPGATVLQIGSGIQIMSLAAPQPPRLQPFFNSYRAAGDSRYLMAAMLNGGTVFEWARGVLGASWDEMYAAGFAEGADSGGALFLPYASGERAPLLDPGASASWTGLRLGVTRAQMIRAVFEGVALAIRDSWEALQREGAGAAEILLAGGGTRDPRWRQMLADTLGLPLRPAGDHGHAALGAAFTAGLAVGHWSGPDALPVPKADTHAVIPRTDPAAATPSASGLGQLRRTYAALRGARSP